MYGADFREYNNPRAAIFVHWFDLNTLICLALTAPVLAQSSTF
jgi:hypothetical protein